jgi:ADP-heptose:LPS heptosyltransferase
MEGHGGGAKLSLPSRGAPARKLLLKCGLAMGDIVMLTAAVRDLHLHYPGRFVTGVHTPYPELWENNPHVADVAADDAGVETIECSYPLIHGCNEKPQHCLNGFIEFLNQRLGLRIVPTAFKGDIHLSIREKASSSEIHHMAGKDIPFWIVAAGGKYDITIKWWDPRRYQEVINHFRGRIQFVQVGEFGHHHPQLEGVIDLRGQTSLRDLVCLVHHSQGVLCPVTGLMHLAAAVPIKRWAAPTRACVVIAGGREPAHWEAYPAHQFIHTIGTLPCCANGGCWKHRIQFLRDGDPYDKPSSLCVRSVNGLPACMDMITAQEVIRRIDLYFQGGAFHYLSSGQRQAAQRSVRATKRNSYDKQPLTLSSAGMACDQFVCRLKGQRSANSENGAELPDQGLESLFHGRGIVICASHPADFDKVRPCIQRLKRLGCPLPVQLWHLRKNVPNQQMGRLLKKLGVECIDAFEVRRRFPVRSLRQPGLRAYAALYSRFRELLLLDANRIPDTDPGPFFDAPQFLKVTAVFWPVHNRARNLKAGDIWKSCGLRRPNSTGFATGQILVNKQLCWHALRLAVWFNENADFYSWFLDGDGEIFHLAFRKLKLPYLVAPDPRRSDEQVPPALLRR